MTKELVLFFQKINYSFNNIQYLQGFPNVDKPFKVKFEPRKDGVDLFNNDNTPPTKSISLDRDKIINISVEDQSTIEKRIGFTRLMMVGIFALAWKKRSKVPLSFMIIEYVNEFGDTQEIYIQCEKKEGFQQLTNLKYNLKKYWKACDENQNFEEEWSIINNDVKEKDAKNTKSCMTVIVVVIIIVICYYLYNQTRLFG